MANYTQRLDEQLLYNIAQYIKNYQAERGGSPTQREIANNFSTNQKRVNKYIHALVGKGEIELDEKGEISLPGNLDLENYQFIPKIGSVSCGKPTLAVEDYDEVFRLPREFTGAGEFFMLSAKGDSMIGANIFEGDYLVIRRQEAASPGDIVVAIKSGNCSSEESDATLKTLKIKDGKYVLHAENEKYEDIDAKDFRIIGKLKCIIRDMEV